MLASLDELPGGASGAVASFNVLSLHMARAVAGAAEELGRPVVIGIAARHWEAIDAPLLIPSLRKLLGELSVPAALHLDHAKPEQSGLLDQAAGLGFTSVMFDGSALPFEENVTRTAAVVDRCHGEGISVEGELGAIAGEEGVADQMGDAASLPYTAPDQAERFVRETGVDALAIAVGTSHGITVEEPHINLDIIRDTRGRCPDTHLVLHGATGVSAASIRRAVAAGISKINYFSGFLRDGMDEVRASGSRTDNDYLAFIQRLAARWREDAAAQIRLYAGE